METITQCVDGQEDDITRTSKSAHLKDNEAFRAFLSKETNNDSAEFRDYAPTRSLVRAAIIDIMDARGVKRDTIFKSI